MAARSNRQRPLPREAQSQVPEVIPHRRQILALFETATMRRIFQRTWELGRDGPQRVEPLFFRPPISAEMTSMYRLTDCRAGK